MKRVMISLALGTAILGVGFVSMKALAAMRKDPAIAPVTEERLRVETQRLEPETIQVSIDGKGQARALDVVGIAPEVSGTVVEIHPHLEVGGVIPKGEALFVIDPRSFQARRDDAAAQVAQWQAQIERWNTQLEKDRQRLDTVKRTKELAEQEFQRRKNLLEGDDVGSQSAVDQQEQALNAAVDALDQLEQVVEIYPIQIQEAQSSLNAAKARLELAEIDVERTRLVAPFTARVKDHSVEIGQYVSPGREIVKIANDELLEINVALDSLEARKWLQFTEQPTAADSAWFAKVKPVECEVRWVDSQPNDEPWQGVLHRVRDIDVNSRQLFVAVRVSGAEAAERNSEGLPLVDGMFCTVRIPGHELNDVFRIPSYLVNPHDNSIYLSVDGRLRTVPIEIIYRGREEVFVRGDLEAGDVLITTRLINPLENILLEIESAAGSKPS